MRLRVFISVLEKSSVVELTLSDRRESKGLRFNSQQLVAGELTTE